MIRIAIPVALGRTAALVALCLTLSACDKLGPTGIANQAVGNWAQIQLPPGCTVKQIAAEEHGGVAVLCEDGRVFH
jgi:hypothetical protein